MYPEQLTIPMAKELTDFGFKGLSSAVEVKEIMDKIIPRYNSMINEHVAVKIGPVFITKILENYNPTIFPPEYFYPSAWGQTENCLLHQQVIIPKISFMYQYGYSSNLTIGGNLYKIMNEQIYNEDDYKIPTNYLV